MSFNVIELTGHVGVAHCARLLADAGAHVVKLEPMGGDPLRASQTTYFQGLNVNKESYELQYSEDQLAPWLAWADVLVHDKRLVDSQTLRIDPDALTVGHPTLVTCAITPFGQTGPYADFQATELTVHNAGGWANLCPSTKSDPDLPPLKVFGDHCHLMAAVSAATVTLASYYATQNTGYGDYIDYAIQSYVASVLEAALPGYSYKEEVASRIHPRSLIPWRIFEAKDGPIFIVCVEQDQWERLVEFMGNPDWANLETFLDQPSRAENQDLVHTFIQEFVSEWTVDELYHAAQAHRICVAPVLTVAQMASNEHLLARNFMSAHSPAHLNSPVLTNNDRAELRPAPELNTIASPPSKGKARPPSTKEPVEKPLAGIRVLDMTWAWAGPFCSMNLAHLGAEVIRIESAERPDLYRRLPLFPVGVEEGLRLNQSGMFNQWNQGKFSTVINLRDPEGIALVKDMVRKADVLVQNFATGVMQRLGLDYDALRDINPDLVMASISGYGQSGPYKEYMGYGPAMPPLTGLSHATGYEGGEAEELGLSMPNPTSGITAAYGIVAALLEREKKGHGAHLDVSLWEATASLNVEAWMDYQVYGEIPERQGNRSKYMAPHGVFRCHGEDRWIAISCRNDADWAALKIMLAMEEDDFDTLDQRKAREDELDQLISQWCADQDRWQLCRKLQAANIPAFPTFTTEDVFNDPHFQARGFIECLPHPEVGKRAHTGIPWRHSKRPNGVERPAPCIDADTDRVLQELLGLDDAALIDLRERKVIGA